MTLTASTYVRVCCVCVCVYVQQNVGKSMSSSKFVSNLDGMNEGENFGKDLLKVRFFLSSCCFCVAENN